MPHCPSSENEGATVDGPRLAFKDKVGVGDTFIFNINKFPSVLTGEMNLLVGRWELGML